MRGAFPGFCGGNAFFLKREGFSVERFDVLVIGTGSGMIVASTAVENGFKTAVVDSGPMGGTCLNKGCVPSKMLIYPSDVVAIFNEGQTRGVHGTVTSVVFKKIVVI